MLSLRRVWIQGLKAVFTDVTMMKRLLLLAGPPRTGKTTILQKVVEKLSGRGFRIGGMISEEIHNERTRLGFEIYDVSTGQRGILAHVHQPVGPKLGKYRVNLQDLNSIGARSIKDAIFKADVVVVDEIGPMELFSDEFKDAVEEVLASQKPLIATIHYRMKVPMIQKLKSREDAHLVEISLENRDQLPTLIAEEVAKLLEMY
ncbi:MAG: NTPase [Candidatus Bathyarchaeota archaeon]|nr:MAG: NTPase [Candidatus Bathyarchaeota archaeon]